jgi:hypothetical protein
MTEKQPIFSGCFQALENDSLSVMAGLRPGHPRLSCLDAAKTWMPGRRPGMTSFAGEPNLIAAF